MKEIKYHLLDCQTFTEAMRGKVEVIELEDLTGKVPHVGYGGASKSKYFSPKTDRWIYVLERNGWYAGDAYANDVWQFDNDFTADEARRFIEDWDRSHKDVMDEGMEELGTEETGFLDTEEDMEAVYEDAKDKAIELLDEIVESMIEAEGNPPAWVKDEDIWDEAKAAVEPYKSKQKNYWSTVSHVYKEMGGEIA